MFLIFSLVITACAADKQDEAKEPAPQEENITENNEEAEEKLDFQGRTMNVVTTSEKICGAT